MLFLAWSTLAAKRPIRLLIRDDASRIMPKRSDVRKKSTNRPQSDRRIGHIDRVVLGQSALGNTGFVGLTSTGKYKESLLWRLATKCN